MNVGELLIRIGADTGDLRRGVREARREVDSLPDEHVVRIRIDDNRGGLDRLGGTIKRNHTMLQAFISLLPIAAAGIGVTAGAMGGLVSMLGSATLGTAGFAAVATATLNDVLDAQKNITKAQEDMAKASNEAERQTATENLAKAYVGLNEGQLAALGSLQRFKSFWDDFTLSFQAPVVTSFSLALDGLRSVLESLAPTIKAAGYAIAGVFSKMNEAFKGDDAQNFFAWLEKSVAPVIGTFGGMFTDTMLGIMNLMRAFQPVSDSMQGGFRGMTQAFLNWTRSLATSESFQRFLNFVITTAPDFIFLIQQIGTILMQIIPPFAELGKLMLRAINVVLALFTAFTALVFGASNAKQKVIELGNAIKTLFGFGATTANNQAESIFDVDKAFQDMLSSVEDTTSGLEDAKKASDNFLQSFDEIHNINPTGSGSGGKPTIPTIPTLPTIPSTGGGGNSGDGSQISTDWLQKLIDKIKQIPPLIPLKIDPPDAGLPAVVTAANAMTVGVAAATASAVLAFQSLINKMYEFPTPASFAASVVASMAASMASSGISAQAAWHGMLDYMQSQLNAYSPFLSFGWGLLLLELGKLIPTSEEVKKAWHETLDYMQSQLNAYEPYLEYGLSLIGAALTALAATMGSAASAWEKGFQAIMSAASRATSPIVQMIDSIRASYASLMAMMGQPIVIPPIQLPAMPKIEMPQIVTDISDALKNFDYAEFFKDKTKSLGEAGLDMLLGATGLKGAQGAYQAGKLGIPALKQLIESILSGGGKAVTGFATGGVIGSDSIVRLGEKGRKEAVVPLETNDMQPFANAIAAAGGGGGGGGKGDIILQIDGVTFARLIAPYGVKESQRIGGSMITT